MANENTEKRVDLEFFRLDHEGDFINARIMHKSVDTIEKFDVHPILSGGKRRRVKCLGEGCPLCEKNAEKQVRIFIHLYDYGTNKHLVWDRTDKILSKLEEIQSDWGDLCENPVKITRDSNEFPTFSVTVLPKTKFPMIDGDTVDTKVSYRCGLYRSAEEMKEYLSTGVMPPHKKKDKDSYTPKKTSSYFSPQTSEYGDYSSASVYAKDSTAYAEGASTAQFEGLDPDEELPF